MNTRSLIVVDATEPLADMINERLSIIPGAQIAARAQYDRMIPSLRHDPISVVDLVVLSVDQFGQDLKDLAEEERPERVCYCLITTERTRHRHHDVVCAARRVARQREVYKWDMRYLALDAPTDDMGRLLGFEQVKLVSGQADFQEELISLSHWMQKADTAPWV